MPDYSKIGGLVTPGQLDVVKALQDLHMRFGPNHCWAPKALGAYRSSHHTQTLGKLLAQGYVDRTPIVEGTGAGRPRYCYKLTDKGFQLWEELKSMMDFPAEQLMGGRSAQVKYARVQRMLATPA